MGYKVKRMHSEHVNQVAVDNGIPVSVAKSIISAYLEDLRTSLRMGQSVTVPGLFTITVTEDEDGREIRGAVSTTIKREVRGW